MSSKNKFSYFSWVRKSVVIHSSVFTLIVSPLPIASNQAMAETNGAVYAGVGLNVLKQAGQLYLQQKQQSFAMAAQAQQFASLQPKTTQDKFFGCPLPEAVSSFPNGACEMPVHPRDPQAQSKLSEYAGFSSIASAYSDLYTKMSTPGNTRMPIGLQCMEEMRKEVASAAQKRLNELTKISTELQKNNDSYRQSLNTLQNEMKTTNYELTGKGGPSSSDKNTNSVTKNLADLFTSSCQASLKNAIGGGSIKDLTARSGLNGLKDIFTETNEKAVNYDNNLATFKRTLNDQLQLVKAEIKENGIASWQSTDRDMDAYGGINFAGSKIAVSIESKKFESKKKAILDRMKPYMNDKYKITEDTSYADAENMVRKSFVHDCVTKNDAGVGLPLDTIYGSLKHGSRGSGNIEKNFSISLKNIMDNTEMTLDEKMDEIAKLQAQYGNGSVTIEYYDPNRNIKTDTPYDLFKNIVAQCEGSYNRNQNEGAKALKKDLSELKTLKEDLPEKVAKAIQSQIEHCNSGGSSGISAVRGYTADSCTAKSFDTKSSSFCIDNANSCSQQTKSCFSRLNSEITQRVTKLNGYGATYNAQVKELVRLQNAQLTKLSQTLEVQGEILRRMFPGGDFNLPTDLLIKTPDESDATFGVGLIGDGNLSFLEKLPGKIEDLKDELNNQQDKINTEIANYIDEQKQNIANNKAKWDKLEQSCSSKINAFQKGMIEGIAKQQDQFNEQQQKAGQFCARYDQLRDLNPAAGCDVVDDLFTESHEVVSFINPEVSHNIRAYKNLCAQTQSEKEKGSDEDKDDIPLISLCEKNSGNWDEAAGEIRDNLLKNIPDDLQKHKGKIRDFLTDADSSFGDLPDAVQNTWGSTLKQAKSLIHPPEETASSNRSIASGKSSQEKLAETMKGVKSKLEENLKTLNNQDEPLVNELYTSLGADTSDISKYLTDVKAKIEGLKALDESKFDGIKEDTPNGKNEKRAARNNLIAAIRSINLELDPSKFQTTSEENTEEDTPTATKNLCQLYQDEANEKAKEGCKDAETGTNKCSNTEVEDNSGKYLTDANKFKNLPKSSRYNSALRKISSIAGQEKADEKKWTTIGQQNTQSCMAQNEDQRNTGNWLDEFDRMVLDNSKSEISVGK